MRACLYSLVLGLLTIGLTAATPAPAAARDNDHGAAVSAQTVPVRWLGRWGGGYRGYYPGYRAYGYYPWTYGYRNWYNYNYYPYGGYNSFYYPSYGGYRSYYYPSTYYYGSYYTPGFSYWIW